MTVAVVDRGCQCRAPEADFFVTSLGEQMRGPITMPSTSLNGQELAERLGFDWSEVCFYHTGDENDTARRWKQAQEDEFERLRKECLSEVENDFTKKVFALQDAVDFSRFRVYGRLMNGRPEIVVCTEFIQFSDVDEFWSKLNAVAGTTQANIWIMLEEEHTDHSYKVGESGEKTNETFGPNHGRMERQVELSWRVEHFTPAQLGEFVAKLAEATQELWDESGVGVC